VVLIVSGFAALFLKLGKRQVLVRTDQGRELGLLERWYTSHNHRGQRNISYVLFMEGSPPDVLLLFQTMLDLCKCHSALRVHIPPPLSAKQETRRVDFVPLEDYHVSHPWRDSTHTIDRVDHRTVMEKVTELINEQFKANLPPWKIVLVSSSTSAKFEIIITVNHLIADGISGMILCSEFLERLRERYQSPVPPIRFSPDPYISLDEAVDLRPTLGSTVRKVLETYLIERIPILRFRPPFIILGPDVSCTHTEQPEFIHFSEEQTALLLQCAKRERTSMHGLLCAIMSLSMILLEQIIHPDSKEGYYQNITTPVNLRPFSEPKLPSNAIGVYISSLNHDESMQTSQNIWDLARDNFVKVKRLVPSVVPLVGMLNFVPSIKDLIDMEMTKFPAGRNSTITISNLGAQSIPVSSYEHPEVGWKLNHVFFTQQHHMGSGSSFILSVVTCLNQLHVSVCSCQPVIPVEWNKLLAQLIRKVTIQFLQATSTTSIGDILSSSQ